MLKAAAAAGYLDERPPCSRRSRRSSRAGADIIITYFAKDVAEWLR